MEDWLTFDLGGGAGGVLAGLYEALYKSPLYQHGTDGLAKEAAATALASLLCHHTGLRNLYEPVFAMLPESRPACDKQRVRRLSKRRAFTTAPK
jgi:hypothetical protein